MNAIKKMKKIIDVVRLVPWGQNIGSKIDHSLLPRPIGAKLRRKISLCKKCILE